ncbi:hypothetical protein SLIQ_20975 [Serratia liquefaciens FK01]|nr:hypothetical protein SLIQ_20975 [Serratia liquefaciens FK01]
MSPEANTKPKTSWRDPTDRERAEAKPEQEDEKQNVRKQKARSLLNGLF